VRDRSLKAGFMPAPTNAGAFGSTHRDGLPELGAAVGKQFAIAPLRTERKVLLGVVPARKRGCSLRGTWSLHLGRFDSKLDGRKYELTGTFGPGAR